MRTAAGQLSCGQAPPNSVFETHSFVGSAQYPAMIPSTALLAPWSALFSDEALTCAVSATFLPKSLIQNISSRRANDTYQGLVPPNCEIETPFMFVVMSVRCISGGWTNRCIRFGSNCVRSRQSPGEHGGAYGRNGAVGVHPLLVSCGQLYGVAGPARGIQMKPWYSLIARLEPERRSDVSASRTKRAMAW